MKLSMFQITLLVVFGGLAIAGILIFSFAIGSGTANTVGAVKIWGTLDQTAFATVLQQAADSNKQLSQVTYVQKDPATYEADLTQALASGTGPDLFLLRQDEAVHDAGLTTIIPLSALSQAQFESTFIEAASPFFTPSGAVGVPILADPLVLYWNKDMLAAAGFSQPPQYWDQLFNMSQKITAKDDAGSIVKATIAFGEYDNIANAKDILATLMLQAGSPITAYDAGGHLTPSLGVGSGASAAAASALRFYTEFADPTQADYSWNRSLPEAQQDFAAGNLALYVGYASEEPLIKATNPNLNFAAAPLPQVRGAQNALDTAHVYAFAASRTGANPTGAITAAFLLVSSVNNKALSTALGIPSARRDVVGQSAQGDDDLFNKQAILAHSWVDPDASATAGLFRDMIENTTSGTLLVGDAIQRANQQMGQILGL
jgi:ABC-type glycerol-3-phosphate transport system substrate-binding protein